jgi:hypothetical protein
MKNKLTETQKNFRRTMGEMNNKKKQPVFKPWMLLTLILVIYLLIQSTGKVGDIYTIHKHEKVKAYMGEVYENYVNTFEMLNDLIVVESYLDIPIEDIYAAKNEVENTERILNGAIVPKQFELFHSVLSDTLVYLHETCDLLIEVSINNRYSPADYKRLLLVSQHKNTRFQIATEQLEKSFEDSKMKFERTGDGFRYYYFTDKFNQ